MDYGNVQRSFLSKQGVAYWPLGGSSFETEICTKWERRRVWLWTPPPRRGGNRVDPKKNPGKKKGASTKCSNCIVRWLIDGFSKTDDNRWLNISFLAQSDEDEILLFEVSRAPSTRRGWIPLVGPHPLPLEKKSHRSFNTWDQTAEKIAKIANYENFWPPDSFFCHTHVGSLGPCLNNAFWQPVKAGWEDSDLAKVTIFGYFGSFFENGSSLSHCFPGKIFHFATIFVMQHGACSSFSWTEAKTKASCPHFP